MTQRPQHISHFTFHSKLTIYSNVDSVLTEIIVWETNEKLNGAFYWLIWLQFVDFNQWWFEWFKEFKTDQSLTVTQYWLNWQIPVNSSWSKNINFIKNSVTMNKKNIKFHAEQQKRWKNYFRLSIANSLVTQYRPHHPQIHIIYINFNRLSFHTRQLSIFSHSHIFLFIYLCGQLNSTQLHIISETCFNVLIDSTARWFFHENWGHLNRSLKKQQKSANVSKVFFLFVSLVYDLTFIQFEFFLAIFWICSWKFSTTTSA